MALDVYRRRANDPEAWRAWIAGGVEYGTLSPGDRFEDVDGNLCVVMHRQMKGRRVARNLETGLEDLYAASAVVHVMLAPETEREG